MNNNDFTVLNHTLVDYNGAGGDITIPDDVIEIADNAFKGCTVITGLTIPEGVKTVGDSAFEGCTALEHVTVADSVNQYGISVFQGCKSLKSVVLGSGANLNYDMFKGCSSLEDLTIPNGVDTIVAPVFGNCTSLRHITLPEDMDEIEEGVFDDCTALERIDVRNGEEDDFFCSKDGVLFSNYGEILMCYPPNGKTEYVIPEDVTEINKDAFENCTKLKRLTIPESVDEFGQYAFLNCSSLESIKIPENVSELPRWVFKNCASLTNIEISENVEFIDEAVFMGCKSLKRIDVAEGNPCFCSIDGVLFSADKKTLIYLPTGGRTEYTIPEGVKEIGPYACADCGNVALTFPKSLKGIGEHGDSWCYKDCKLLDCFSGCKFSKGHLKTKVKINANLAEVLIDNGFQPDVLDAVWVYLVQSMKKLRAFTEPKLEENPAESAEMFIKVLISNKFTAKQYDAVDEFFTKFKDLIPKETANEFREMKKSVK